MTTTHLLSPADRVLFGDRPRQMADGSAAFQRALEGGYFLNCSPGDRTLIITFLPLGQVKPETVTSSDAGASTSTDPPRSTRRRAARWPPSSQQVAAAARG
ncbi:hypothetical protein [Derxia gummosa]|uniref:Uncharacterized protein n=1 Tax=Derxia gummosa DSM 723 TaxID=1121388 RepID=A0A8B6XCK4_9BURK|nr:hypothetical protein [Derxia gummosa]